MTRLGFKARRAYEKLITGQAVNFQGFTSEETINILNAAEKKCKECLGQIDTLLAQKQALENTLAIIRAAKLRGAR